MHKLITSLCALLGVLVLACGVWAAESGTLPAFDYKAHCKDFAQKHGGFDYLEKLCLDGEKRNISYFQKNTVTVAPELLQQCVDDSKAYGQSYLFLGACLQSKGMQAKASTPAPTKPAEQAKQQGNLPEFDINAYCKRAAETLDGSAFVEKSCRDQENRAKKKLQGGGYSDRALEYCTKSTTTIDMKSYFFLEACIKQETKAEKELTK